MILTACAALHSTPRGVPLPAVPPDLRAPADRADYIVRHFWDSLPAPADSSAKTDDGIGDFPRDAVEQAFADFISVFPLASEQARTDAMATLVGFVAADEDAFSLISETAEKYLYNLDSPVVSDEYYRLFLNAVIEADAVSDTFKTRPRWQLEAVMKNRPGEKAADFTFTSTDSKRTSLKEFVGAAGCPVILVFYDPDCEHCRETIGALSASASLARAVESGALAVLAVYSGEDMDLWSENARTLPAEWNVGYDDGTLQEEGLYVIRELPSIYLIDTDGTVILKETTVENILNLKN